MGQTKKQFHIVKKPVKSTPTLQTPILSLVALAKKLALKRMVEAEANFLTTA